VTSQKTADGKVTALEEPETLDGLHGIIRAGRAETTGLTQHRANQQLIASQHPQRERFQHKNHRNILLRTIV